MKRPGWGSRRRAFRALARQGGLVAIALLLAAQPFQAADGADDAVKKRLAGEWTLVKYEIFGENGQTRPGNYDVGRINYGEREMSAHLMRSERPADPQNYLGYFGPYTIDADKKIVVHHVVGSSLRTWIGTEQVRHYGFSSDGAQLTLSLKSGDRITQTLTWERAR